MWCRSMRTVNGLRGTAKHPSQAVSRRFLDFDVENPKKWSSSGAASPTVESGSRSFDVRCASARLHPATTFCTPTLCERAYFQSPPPPSYPPPFAIHHHRTGISTCVLPSCWTTLPSSPRVSLLPTSTASHSHYSATDTVLFPLLCPFHLCRWVGSLVQDLQSSTEQCRCIGKSRQCSH